MKKNITNNNVNLNEGNKEALSKKRSFVESVKKVVRDTVAATGIALSTIMPASVESGVIIPTTATLLAVTSCERPDDIGPTINIPDEILKSGITINKPEVLSNNGTSVRLGNTEVAVCSDESGIKSQIVIVNGESIGKGQTKTIDKPCSATINAMDNFDNPSSKTFRINYVDNTTPAFSFENPKSEIIVSRGDNITMNNKEVLAGEEKICAWDNDDYAVSFKFDGNTIQLPFPVEKDGDFVCILTNKNNGNYITKTVKITTKESDNNKAPEITRKYPENKVPNILGGVTANMTNNQLLFGDVLMYEGKDDNTEICTPSLKLKGSNIEIKTGQTINQSGTYVFTETDEKGKSTSVEFPVKIESIDLTSLNNLNMQVNQEVDLLKGITIPSGVEITKVEVEINGEKEEATDPHHYTPNQSGTCYIYFTEKGEFNNTYVERTKNPLTIKGIEYQSISINNIKPVDILPIIGQVNPEAGDTHAYEHIEHLRIAEATRIRDMMWEYGTGKYSKEEYQQLMSRLNTGMIRENPKGYNNYNIIGGTPVHDPSDHAHDEWNTLDILIKHANLIIIDTRPHWKDLYETCKSDPTKINIMGLSKGADVNKEEYNARDEESIKEYDKEKNWLVFCSGGNIRQDNGIIKNKICQEDYTLDEHSVYGERSRAHNKNDNTLDRHLVITIGTNSTGNQNITNKTSSNYSKFPVGFHNKILFAGRTFPYLSSTTGMVSAERSQQYATSHTNYVNVAIMDLLFQMFAEVKDVDELLEMVRSTSLKDYIKLNNETQELQLMNPAGFFKEYCMIVDVPSTINPGETVMLTKGRYKGLIFDIPGAEVFISGKGWTPYTKENESIIKAQNPMNLEWRLNGTLANNMGYKGKNVNGKIITVDDKRNGLNIDKDITVKVN